MRTILIILWVVIGCTGCAVPRSDIVLSDIDKEELQVIQLAREATFAFQRSRFVDARLGFESVLYVRPELRNIQENLATVLTELALYDDAKALLLELLSEHPQSFRLHMSLSLNAFRSRDFIQAKTLYTTAFELAESQASKEHMSEAALGLSSLSLMIGQIEESECYAFLAYSLLPRPDIALPYLRTLLAQDKLEEVTTFLKEATSIDVNMRVYQALAFLGQFELESAEQTLSRVQSRLTQLNPTSASDYQLAISLLQNFEFVSSGDGLIEAEYRVGDEEQDSEALEALLLQINSALEGDRGLAYPSLYIELLHQAKSFIVGYLKG